VPFVRRDIGNKLLNALHISFAVNVLKFRLFKKCDFSFEGAITSKILTLYREV